MSDNSELNCEYWEDWKRRVLKFFHELVIIAKNLRKILIKIITEENSNKLPERMSPNQEAFETMSDNSKLNCEYSWEDYRRQMFRTLYEPIRIADERRKHEAKEFIKAIIGENSNKLPVHMSPNQETFETAGFTFANIDENNMYEATLPKGWSIVEVSDPTLPIKKNFVDSEGRIRGYCFWDTYFDGDGSLKIYCQMSLR